MTSANVQMYTESWSSEGRGMPKFKFKSSLPEDAEGSIVLGPSF